MRAALYCTAHLRQERPRLSDAQTRELSRSVVLKWPNDCDRRQTLHVVLNGVCFVTGMVLFRPSEPPLAALDRSTPRLLRMAPLRHSLRMAPRLDARDTDDTASTLSAPDCGEEDGGISGECTWSVGD
jgi:hypothetical protein